MTRQKDINAALRFTAPSTNGRIIVIRQAEDNSIKLVFDCATTVLPSVIRKLCREAARKSIAVWELATSKEWGPLSLRELDVDDTGEETK